MRLRRADGPPSEVISLKRSSVHVLRTEEELREAVERASEFDQRAADTLHTRSQHYRTLIATPLHQADPVLEAD